MKKSQLQLLISKTIKQILKEELAMVSDSQLDDATELLMLISGRIMSAQGKSIPADIIAKAIEHIEQADGILAAAGLEANEADI